MAQTETQTAVAVDGLSLKGRALRYLAAREHSRAQLARKLKPHASSAEALEALLDALQAKDLLSEVRLAQAVVRRGAAKFGDARLHSSLRAQGLGDEPVRLAMGELEEDEFSRAHRIWLKKFGQTTRDPAAQAKQMRFLAARGFSQETIYRVLRGGRGEE